MSIKLRHVSFILLFVLAACSQSDPGVGPTGGAGGGASAGGSGGAGSIDSAMAPETTTDATFAPVDWRSTVSTDLPAIPPGPPTLETGVDRAALAAAVTPQVIQFIRANEPDAAADTIQLGRPWGEFDVHKGPQLVFRGFWRMLVAINGDYFAVVGVVRDGESYKMASIGSEQFVPMMAEREKIPAVSAALDRGRAGFLRRIIDGGEMLVAYETEPALDAGQAEIRVQPLFGPMSWFQGIDAGEGGIPELSLDEIDPLLPAE